jgi:hypothetical protein
MLSTFTLFSVNSAKHLYSPVVYTTIDYSLRFVRTLRLVLRCAQNDKGYQNYKSLIVYAVENA